MAAAPSKTLDDLRVLVEKYADGPHIQGYYGACRNELFTVLQGLIADAERYRWLRNFATEDEWAHFWEKDPPELMDAAIDAARATAAPPLPT